MVFWQPSREERNVKIERKLEPEANRRTRESPRDTSTVLPHMVPLPGFSHVTDGEGEGRDGCTTKQEQRKDGEGWCYCYKFFCPRYKYMEVRKTK